MKRFARNTVRILVSLGALAGLVASNGNLCGTDAAAPPEVQDSPPTDPLTIWPNAQSVANSDPWLRMHHDQLLEMHPRVLVLNFTNGFSASSQLDKVNRVIFGLRTGSRYHAYSDPKARAFLKYEIAKIVDLSDAAAPPPGWKHLNGAKYPLRCAEPAFNYSSLFSQQFADYYQIADPKRPAHNLTLAELVAQGVIHELWIMVNGEPDAYTCSNGFVMKDFQLDETLEYKQLYDARGQPIAGQFDRCAGNGCWPIDDLPALQPLGRSFRMLYINTMRGAGTAIHSLGHGFEQTGRQMPEIQASFLHFANFDLTRFGPEFPPDLYGQCTTGSMCIQYANSNSLSLPDPHKSSNTLTATPYDQGCGSVHFPPNARSDYDTDNSQAVLSTCEHFGLHDGAMGEDQTELYSDAISKRYDSIGGVESSTVGGHTLSWSFEDGGGGWQIYWRQSLPGLGNQAKDASGAPIKNWWPYLFY